MGDLQSSFPAGPSARSLCGSGPASRAGGGRAEQRLRKRRGQRAEAVPGCAVPCRAVPGCAVPDTPEPRRHGRARGAAAGGSHPGARAAGAGRALHTQRDPVSGAGARAGGRAHVVRPGALRALISRSRRAVLRKASALEYKIQRRALRKEDFINYIQVGFSEQQSAAAPGADPAQLDPGSFVVTHVGNRSESEDPSSPGPWCSSVSGCWHQRMKRSRELVPQFGAGFSRVVTFSCSFLPLQGCRAPSSPMSCANCGYGELVSSVLGKCS